ncbi:hypothetical protein CEP52_017631 [Fusarium oligoseptatum]|uniref:Uncharacterized protein n=1 Tax=Fusarium oligoseptatum TaxID=2604345 RepID=A0A428RLN4_9HYPO|nr:hypothetical protein CEP52_017631 [Fusarium oligoseptatum]
MSQAMGWADNVILAMGPLGKITAIVSAIWVRGSSWLKAITGRARESRAILAPAAVYTTTLSPSSANFFKRGSF